MKMTWIAILMFVLMLFGAGCRGHYETSGFKMTASTLAGKEVCSISLDATKLDTMIDPAEAFDAATLEAGEVIESALAMLGGLGF